MLALITQRDFADPKLGKLDALEQNYVDYYHQDWGFTLVPVSTQTKVLGSYFDLDPSLIILSGGNDISPDLYNGKPFPSTSISKQRDRLERKIISAAINRKIPILGECRGMQLLNTYFKGTLLPDIKQSYQENHTATTHPIQIIHEDLAKTLGIKNATVNSYHNQGITEKELSPQLKAFAKTKNGIIEGIYHPNLPILGIMWHPERGDCTKQVSEKIIDTFLRDKNYFTKT
ncbi:gamma-glutamyl-gamma-aminobutyrate hydrolase family protein [Candidatus Pacearchaeota archaeon]|nr:gamma-glutamyl-gamma-aminobutyrate hydrolase family protein [Candidatus Pacearchaeota archaeon]